MTQLLKDIKKLLSDIEKLVDESENEKPIDDLTKRITSDEAYANVIKAIDAGLDLGLPLPTPKPK